ncbi:hypothetical protein ACT691_04410 [Vibrio metschnikovii]
MSLAEKKILSEEFREPISQINSTVVQLLPVVEKLRGTQFISSWIYTAQFHSRVAKVNILTDLYLHHFSDLALAISDEIMVQI